jgi:hypothetical protein
MGSRIWNRCAARLSSAVKVLPSRLEPLSLTCKRLRSGAVRLNSAVVPIKAGRIWYARTRNTTLQTQGSGCKYVKIGGIALKRGLCLVDQAMVDCVKGKFETIGNAELIKNVMQVILDCLFADKELFANLLVAVALSDQLHDFLFSIA